MLTPPNRTRPVTPVLVVPGPPVGLGVAPVEDGLVVDESVPGRVTMGVELADENNALEVVNVGVEVCCVVIGLFCEELFLLIVVVLCGVDVVKDAVGMVEDEREAAEDVVGIVVNVT